LNFIFDVLISGLIDSAPANKIISIGYRSTNVFTFGFYVTKQSRNNYNHIISFIYFLFSMFRFLTFETNVN
jgi:hypothetical protein